MQRGYGVCASTLLAFALACSVSNAALINYGNSPVLPPGYQYTNVFEASGTDPVPLYGAPDYSNGVLDFDPPGFVAFSTNGNSDVTDGQLNFGLKGDVTGQGLTNFTTINLFEAGDYDLVGTGTAATSVFAGAIMRVTVTQINGVNVTPFDLPASSASVGFNLIANPGVVQPWSLGTSFVVNLPQGQKATGLEVSFDNSLLALSEAGSIAKISKKDFRVTLGTEFTPIPEPTTLAGCGLVALGLLKRRRAD